MPPTEPSAAPIRRPLPLRRRLLFACVPLFVLLLLGEVVLRLVRDPLHFGSFRALRVDLMRRGYPAIIDARLGYAPKPDYADASNHWGTTVTIDHRGLRSNGNASPPNGVPVVAVGDSFTFGDQVDDDETWPAHLEQLLQRPVRNGGVFGYSLTQAVLRAEQLLAAEPVAWLVVSLIPDDINRSEFSRRYTALPWFDLVDGKLVLCNVPVQETAAPDELRQRWFKDLLGHSALLDGILSVTAKQWWITDQKEQRIHPPGKGGELAPHILDRIAASCRERSVRLLLVMQGDRHTDESRRLLAHAAATAVPHLDLITAFLQAEQADPSVRERWWDGHMTDAGNRWVAEQIAAVLRRGD